MHFLLLLIYLENSLVILAGFLSVYLKYSTLYNTKSNRLGTIYNSVIWHYSSHSHIIHFTYAVFFNTDSFSSSMIALKFSFEYVQI